MRKKLLGSGAVVIVLAASWVGWNEYQGKQESEVAAGQARRTLALISQQISMVQDSATSADDYFSASKRATQDLSACPVELDSAAWRHRAEDRDTAKALCTSAKKLVDVMVQKAHDGIDGKQAKAIAEEASAAISKASSRYEIDRLSSTMNKAFEVQISLLELRKAQIKPNHDLAQSLLADERTAVQKLAISGLSPDDRAAIERIFPAE